MLDKEEDLFKKHIKDTLIAGDGSCNEAVVEMMIKEGLKRFNELILWGANFDLDAEGNYDLGKEEGHSEYRVAHHKDITGHEVEHALLQRVHQLENVTLLTHHFAIDLITEHDFKLKKHTIYHVMGLMFLTKKQTR